MESVIYYFSATGNSLKVAKDLAEGLGNTNLIKICSDTMNETNIKGIKKIGIVFPVYYYGLPIMVKEFVEKLSLDSDSYVYTIATCGGSVGSAIKQVNNMLSKKGIPLACAFTIVMPDNYQVMYSPPSKEKQQKLFNTEHQKINYIVQKIHKAETGILEEKNSFASKLLSGLLSSTFKPKAKDKNFWIDEKCNGCGICSKVCPSKNILMEHKKPQWLHQCEHCLACMHWCPKHSLQYKRGTIKRERYHHPEITVSELFQK